MSDDASQFVGDIPQQYDRGLGPVIFHDYADEIARRATALGGARVLELAAGTGIVSQRLRAALPDDCELTVTDLNAPMLEIARAKLSQEDRTHFQTANAMELPFEDDSFDLIVCQFGVMFFPDKRHAFAEAARVLRPGGHYLFNTWGDMDANPFAQVGYDAGAEFFPDDPPGFYKVPFSYHDPADVTADMAAGGLADATAEAMELSKEMTDWTPFAHSLVFGNPLIDEIRNRGGVEPEAVRENILTRLRARFGPEPSSMPLRAMFFHGRAP